MALVRAEREHLERISTTLNTNFLQFREATWHTHVMDVHMGGNQIMLHLSEQKPFRRHGWWSMFPSHIVGLANEQNKNAVLTTMAIFDIAHLTTLISQMFQGLDFHLEEISLRILPPARRTIVQHALKSYDFNDYDFWVFRATSRTTAQQWTLHLAGAQYGIHPPGSPWPEFESKHVYKVLAVHPFGTLQNYVEKLSQKKGLVGMELALQAQAMSAWHRAVDPAMAKKKLTWHDVLFKPPLDFSRHTAKILVKGSNAIEAFVRDSRLTKRRGKAERHEKCHEEELREEKRGIDREVLGYEDMVREIRVEGMVLRISRHEQPGDEVLRERCGWDMEQVREKLGGEVEEVGDGGG